MYHKRFILPLIAMVFLIAIVPVFGEQFEPTWKSLEAYECPEWFRDAKLGIFICWNPYTVPATGDWYARHMYMQGHRQYKYHVEHYGHPSKVGYKDIIAMWKGEKFDADKLVQLFKRAGAKYIVPMAMHHDNFDLWDSKHHKWNSVNMGPKKDIVGLWRKATLKHGLRFGTTTHLARSYSWFQTSHGSDKEGPFKGVPYDGRDPNYQDLYHETHGDTTKRYAKNPPEKWKNQWYMRLKDLVDQHQPDMLYFDGGVPFGEVGRRMVAYYFNQNMKWHGGKLEGVFNIKNLRDHGEYREGICVLDLERRMSSGIRELPWQTDTSIGDWFWTDPPKYRSVKSIIDMLVDIVSKNGNLLMNVPPKEDGTLDPKAVHILEEMGRWMDVNGEAIYGTRPWIKFGEEGVKMESDHFRDRDIALTWQNIRFTTKGKTLYAISHGWPEGKERLLTIGSLGIGQDKIGVIESVRLLGHEGKLKWQQDAEGLKIQLPQQKPCDYAVVFKIQQK